MSIYPQEVGWLPVIALIPLAGAIINASLGKRLGKMFVGTIGVMAPAMAFMMALAFFFVMQMNDQKVAIRGDLTSLGHVHTALIKANIPADKIEAAGPGGGNVLRIAAALEDVELIVNSTAEGGIEVARAGDLAPHTWTTDLGSWIRAGDFDVRFSFALDRLSIILVLVITGVGALIHLYSTSYMSHEDAGGFARYFAYLNLFVSAMLVLVMAGDLFLLFVGWEGVGLCSYLLIGFHYKDPANAACGSKAFIVNRIGDLAFVLGAFALLMAVRQVPHAGTFGPSISAINDLAVLSHLDETRGKLDPTLVGVACLLMFIGCTGKSAQIPLHLWLPDAMAGPTPVSALIHAATMVTAGIYLIARLSPVFAIAYVEEVPVLGIVAVTGALTAFFAGTAALGQDDIKKVLAYSTVSQLGYMFIGVGCGASGAAVFHLVTHAFFKALLFLGAGSVIHATGTQSMREMGGLRRFMPTTFLTMCVGALALAALVPLSGFFSKDMILFEVLARSKVEHASGWWQAIYVLGVLTGGITAIYSARMICMTFMGEHRGKGHPHESPVAMTLPLVILAVLALGAGLLGLPEVITHSHPTLPSFLDPAVTTRAEVSGGGVAEETLHSLEWIGLFVGVVVGLLGAGLGVWLWNRPPAQVPWEAPVPGGALEATRDVLSRAWLYDDLVNKQGVQPATKYVSSVLWKYIDDQTIDKGLVDGAGRVAGELSSFTRWFQNGQVSRYALYFVVGAIALPLLTLGGLPAYRFLIGFLQKQLGH